MMMSSGDADAGILKKQGEVNMQQNEEMGADKKTKTGVA